MSAIFSSPRHRSYCRNKVKNVKKLSDICLQCIGENLASISGVGRYLAPAWKELLLQRLVNHDKLTPEFMPFITYNLFSKTLRNVEFYKSEQVVDSVLRQLRDAGCVLHSLIIRQCKKVTDVGILAVTQQQNELVRLELQGLSSLTSSGLANVTSPALRRLSLRDCGGVSAQGVTCLASRNPSIQSLDLCYCSNLDSSVFQSITYSLRHNLEELFVDHISILNDTSLISLAENCPNLRRHTELTILHPHLIRGVFDLDVIARLSMMSSLRIGEQGMMRLLSQCTGLHSLDVAYCRLLERPPGSQLLLQFPCSLQYLSLCGVMLEDTQLFVKAITNLPALTLLRLAGVPALNDHTLEEILAVIGWRLEQLDLSFHTNNVTDNGLRSVTQHCRNLHMLALSMMRAITGVTLLPMFSDAERAARILKLDLKASGVTIEVLHAIALSCSNISDLDLAGLIVVDDTLLQAFAENCPHLIDINIKGCRQVTDQGVCELARCCPLTGAVLSGLHHLTDKTIFMLANSCPYLESIYLNGCSQISTCALRYLQDCCIPRVNIHHKTPNVVPDQLMAKNLDTGEFCRADLLAIS